MKTLKPFMNIVARLAILAIILGVIVAGVRDKSESTESPESTQVAEETPEATVEATQGGSSPYELSAAGIGYKDQLGVLYRELLIFKDDLGFHTNGFAPDGQYRWMAELRELEKIGEANFKSRLARISLMQLGQGRRDKAKLARSVNSWA